MRQVNIHEAKTRLSELIAAVEAGEEVVIARAGKPVVRLVHEAPPPKVYRQGGGLAGLIRYDDEQWAAADAELAEVFEESINRPLDPAAHS